MIDSQTNIKLIERFSPKGSLLDKHHQRLLEILIYFDKICRENNIRYWLSSGTALGAVRHGGFIPWDDDADVEMLREDVEKLKAIFSEKDGYALQTQETDPFYSAPYGKFRDLRSRIEEHPQDTNYVYKGVYIDVFVLDKCPSLMLFKICALLGWKLVLESGNANTLIKKKFYFFNKKLLFSIFGFLSKLFKLLPTSLYRHCLGSTFSKPRFLKDIFPLKEIEFENHKFFVPKNCNAYLSKIYGDYNKLPDFDNLHVHVSNVEIF